MVSLDDVRARTLLRRVSHEVGPIPIDSVVFAHDGGDIAVLSVAAAQADSDWPTIAEGLRALGPPPPNHVSVLCVLVFPRRFAVQWIAVAPLTSSGGAA